MVFCQFIPPHVLEHIAKATAGESLEPAAAQRTAVISKEMRNLRQRAPLHLATMPSLTGPRPGKSERGVYDAGHGFEFEVTKVRGEGTQRPPSAT